VCHATRRIHLPALVLALLVAAAAPARAGYFTSYEVTLDAGYSDVTNIVLMERDSLGGSSTWAFTALGDPSRPSTTVINNPFEAERPTAESFLIGLTKDLPGDAEGQEHVVLMMDDTAADLANHIAWGTLFRNTLEQDVIDAIKLGTSGQDFPIVLPGINFLSDFANGDGTTGILGPLGVPRPVWFATGGTFSVMSFSDGLKIGSGISRITPTPEPTSLALVGVGTLAMLGGLWRRRRRR
jgi:hypothetical protein